MIDNAIIVLSRLLRGERLLAAMNREERRAACAFVPAGDRIAPDTLRTLADEGLIQFGALTVVDGVEFVPVTLTEKGGRGLV
jgi:hypothetical protein